MTILVTNDDGIDEPGIDALRRALHDITPQRIVTVAPSEHQSGVGHRVNIRSDIVVKRRTESEISVDSTPADCVRLGIKHLYDDVECIVSGINDGCNLGSDMYPSGTIAAAREATLHGLRGIALSQFKKTGFEPDWQRTRDWAVRVLPLLLDRPAEPGLLWSVNFPYLETNAPEPEIVFCTPCRRPLLTEYQQTDNRFRYTGDDINRQSSNGTDVSVCLSGQIAVAAIHLW